MGLMEVGPVFWNELRRVSRHRWTYIVRSILVGGLLLGLGMVTLIGLRRLDLGEVSELAKIGEWFFQVTAAVQLLLVLLAAPAAMAGAFCTEMARGHVSLMLVSGVSPNQIIFGTLGARLLHLLGAVACGLPVLCVSSSLGGVPPDALVGLELVTMGTAVLGSAVALAVSILSRRLYETLMTSYCLLGGWVLGYGILFTIRMTALGRLVPAGWVAGFLEVNPFWLALRPIVDPRDYRPAQQWLFLAGAVCLASGIAALAAWLLRVGVLTDFSLRRGPFRLPRLHLWRMVVSLDAWPVFWRECRTSQASFWSRLVWGFYVVGAIVFTVLAVTECTTRGTTRVFWPRPYNGFQAAVGLGLLSLLAPATLAEERARNSLGLLLSTPLSSRSLVLGKWFACYRVVPFLALLTAAVAAAHAAVFQRWSGVFLATGMILAQGAAVTSLGIALATWVPRVERALILSATASVLITAGWIPLVLVLFGENSLGPGLAMASPLFGIVQITIDLASARSDVWHLHESWALVWIAVFSAVSLALLLATLATFDRCLGRITLCAPAFDSPCNPPNLKQ
jgi:ABC-type transport system involved in multi-copper enzyme maturation permease subunit